MSDALIEAGQSDELIEAVRQVIAKQWMTEQKLPVFRFAATLIVDRLRAGGISDLTIMNTIVQPHKSFKEIKDEM